MNRITLAAGLLLGELSTLADTPTDRFYDLVDAADAMEVGDLRNACAAETCFRYLEDIRALLWPKHRFTGPLSSIYDKGSTVFRAKFESLSASSPISPAQDASAAQVTA